MCCQRSKIELHESVNKLLISEGLAYHLDNQIDLNENIYRPQSTSFVALFTEARQLLNKELISLGDEDTWYLTETDLGLTGTYKGITVPLDYPMTREFLLETKAKSKPKKHAALNKPHRGGSKKFYVFVRNPKTGKIKKISFGDTTGLKAKINNPKARKSFAARHKCAQKKDKTQAGYWACRLPRYSKLLGLKSNFSGYW
jgi:hypothetical protein